MSETGTTLPNLAFHGLMGAGKTTLSELAIEHFGYQRVSFAGLHPGGLRDIATRIWGEEALNDRGKLQGLGMLVRRLDEDAFVNALTRHIDGGERGTLNGPLVLDDLRFPNEAWALKGMGFSITRVAAGRNVRVDRLKANAKLQDESQLNHPSEGALRNWPDDFRVINERKTHAELLDELGRIIKLESRSI